MPLRADWDEWKDLKFLRYLPHAEYAALAQGEWPFLGIADSGCSCGGWQQYHKTHSGHRKECPRHAQILRAMALNPR